LEFKLLNKNENPGNLISGKKITRDITYNFIGLGLPLIFALILIPPLIKGFGEDRFGILNLVWMVIGYFSFFDLGIGRTLTKIVAEKIGLERINEIPQVVWTSLILMTGVSLIGMLLLFFLSPLLVYQILNISPALQEETLSTFYLLALAIPVISTSAGLRGILEAHQQFGVLNIIRVGLGILTFLGPLICLFFTNSLFWVVVILIFIRVLVWIIYMSYCFRLNSDLKRNFGFSRKDVKPILKLSGWITVSNTVAPLIIYSDRFLIGAILSTAAITYYATPFEFVSRLLLIPTALISVLFPVFSINYIKNPEFVRRLFLTGTKFVFIFLYPIVIAISTFAFEGIELWLGSNFAQNSSLVLQFLAWGVLFNGLAFIPFTFLQSSGKAHITGTIHLVELPIYLTLIWLGIKYYGINGAAFIWLFRMIVDAGLLLFYANRTFNFRFRLKHSVMTLLFFYPVLLLFVNDFFTKSILVAIITITFFIFSWKYFLANEEKVYLRMNILRRITSD
jgi:O-antigen/teichoic acid export membrane protein